ncbi:T9SS type A sorting domain-containing protein [Bacteroidota bacterium]
MKTLYKILLVLGLSVICVANAISQIDDDTLRIVRIIIIDTNDDGDSDALEIEFDEPIEDGDFDGAAEYNDWYIGNSPTDTINVNQGVGFDSDVTVIANATGKDVYCRIEFNNIPGDALADDTDSPIYFRYIYGGGKYLVCDEKGPTAGDEDTLFTMTGQFPVLVEDASPPFIEDSSIVYVGGDPLEIDDTIKFKIELFAPEDGLVVSPAEYNGSNLNWMVEDDTIFIGTYVVKEGDPDQTNLDFNNVTITDVDGNTSLPANFDVTRPIDANKPGITQISYSPGDGQTLKIGETVRVTFRAENSEESLGIDSASVNGVDVIGTFGAVAGSPGYYKVDYSVSDGDNSIDDNTEAIPVNLAFDDGTYITSPVFYDSTILSSPGIDAAKPVISDISSDAESDANILKVGETIIFTVDLGSDESNATISPTTFNGGTLTWSPFDSDTYTATYTVEEGQTDQAAGALQLGNVTVTDENGNPSDALAYSDITRGIDANTNQVDTVTSDANSTGTLLVDESITFTVVPETAELGLIITPTTYNGQPLSAWTPDGTGANYTATYDIDDGDANQLSAPLQLLNVKIEDGEGNLSDNFNGSDVAKLIDANKPVISDIFSDAESDANILKVGETILFTVDLGGSESNATISPTIYNGGTLTWSPVDADTYTATYTVEEGHLDQGAGALQLGSVTVTDENGNPSDALAYSDITRGIDANTPQVDTVTSDANSTGTLLVDESITFTVVPETAELGLIITPTTYNGQPLSAWTPDGTGANYTATYDIDDGDANQLSAPLQLLNVKIEDGEGNLSDNFNGSDVAKLIDANKPVISDIFSDAESDANILKVGETILFTVDLGGSESNATISPTTYNGGTLTWSPFDADTYTATYTVEEGQLNRTPGALQLGSVTVTDENGNPSDALAYSDITRGIDANTPTIIGVDIPNTPKILGDVVQATITVNPESETFILNSGNVDVFPIDSIEKNLDFEYYAYFTVTAIGYDIEADQNYSVSNLVLSDNAGNVSSTYSEIISQANDAIYTILPTAKVTGEHHICDEDSAELSCELTGNAPWNVNLYDGTSTTPINGISESPFTYKVEAVDADGGVDPDTVTYKITQVTDVNGNVKVITVTDSAIVYAYEIPSVIITDPPGDKTYNVDAEADTLVGAPLDGVFSGNGIVPSNNTFVASSAGVGTHEIIYEYTEVSPANCFSSDTIEFTVDSSNAVIEFDNSDDDWRCEYELTMDLNAYVIDKAWIIGDLFLPGAPVAITDHGDNTATINIQLLSAGTYEVRFDYVDGTPVSVFRSFTVESVSTSVDITDITDHCVDYDSIFVNAFDLDPSGGTGQYFFSGSGDAFEYDPADPKNNSGYFLPDSIVPGAYNLKYVYTTVKGCNSDTVIKTFNIDSLPTVSFTMDAVYNIDEPLSVISGDPLGVTGVFEPQSFMSNNGDGTADFLPSDAGLGLYWIYYTYEDSNTCVNTDSMQIEITEALGDITSSSGSFWFCYWGTEIDTLTGTPNPTDGTTGSFYIDDVLITPESDNKIVINPKDYLDGDHTVKFEYYDGPTLYKVIETMTIDSITEVFITSLTDKCEDYDTIFVKAESLDPVGGIGLFKFSGSATAFEYAASPDSGYFLPDSVDPGSYNLKYVYNAPSGCPSDTVMESFVVNPLPVVSFITIDTVYNIAQGTDTITGSPGGPTGEFSPLSFMSNNPDGTAYFDPADAGLGMHNVIYTYTDVKGCVNRDSIEIEVNEALGSIASSKSFFDFCYWGTDIDTLIGTTVPTDGTAGNFYIDNVLITPESDNKITIDASDYDAGNHSIRFEYYDGEVLYKVFKTINIDSVAEVFITDITEECHDYDTIFIDAFGQTPTGGTGTFKFSGSGTAFEYDPADPNNNNGYLLPGEIDPGTYNIKYVYTSPATGCNSDTVMDQFIVHPLPVVTFTIDSVYNVDQKNDTLIGNPLGSTGVFTPLAIVSNNDDGTATFDPTDAGLGFRNITYTYEDANGCVNSQTQQIKINQALGDIVSSRDQFNFCFYNPTIDTLTGTPNPTDGTPGRFYIDDILITPSADNQILINPTDYSPGDHIVRFDYTYGPALYKLSQNIKIDSIGKLQFTGLNPEYCENLDEDIEITAIPPETGGAGTYHFVGNGITNDNTEDELGYFNPTDANLGHNTITYTFTRDYSGCYKEYSQNVKINNIPTVAFKALKICVSGPSETITFVADTISTDTVNYFKWDFYNEIVLDDSASFDPIEGTYNKLNLFLRTINGCEHDVDSNFLIGNQIDLKFTYQNECRGDTAVFTVTENTSFQDWVGYNWNFGGSGTLYSADSSHAKYVYDAAGAYDVIYAEFTKTCGRIADTIRLNIRPSIPLATTHYLQEFEDNPNVTGWVVEDYLEGANNSWQWGAPSGDIISSAASGANAFVTNLSGDGFYENGEKAMVTSPCFDFSGLERPMIKLDFICAMEKDRDGVVMQYTRDDDWATIGVPNDGINWYNSFIVSGSPADQQLGWTGDIYNDDNDDNEKWQTAMYRLDDLRGRVGVRFRFVFGSDAAGREYEGFAFDNVEFIDRTRIVLLENFTDISVSDVTDIFDEVFVDLEKDSLDYISLNYHTNFKGSNILNNYYPSGPSARALYYGVTGVPYSVVDGMSKFSYASGNELYETDIHRRVLIDPQFDISLQHNVEDNELIVSSSVKALDDLTGHDVVVYIAVVEKDVVISSEEYRNVLRTMLPDAAGTLIERDWVEGDSVIVFQKQTLPAYIDSEDNLITIVFVQDKDDKVIYQTAFVDEFGAITSIDELIENIASSDYRVYPNPVKEILTIQLLKTVPYDLEINVYNGIGALVKNGKLLHGENLVEFNTNDLPAGVYYLRLTNTDKVIDSKKIIKID